MDKSDSQHDPRLDGDLDDQIMQLYTRQQAPATAFNVIWDGAKAKANPCISNDVFLRFPRWQPMAMAVGFLLTLGIAGTLINAPAIDEQETPLRIVLDRNDELFQALLSSTQWSAPSDIFLKIQPNSAVWGMPTLNIRTPVNVEEVL